MPVQMLERTIEACDASGRGGRPPIERGSFCAPGPVKSCRVFADGGLRASEAADAIGADDLVMPGLFAAGSVGQGGLLPEGHGHHLAWAFVCGRIPGRSAARFAPS